MEKIGQLRNTILDRLSGDQEKKNCKAMCKANFGFDKQLKKACIASCKGEYPPQSSSEFRAMIGENFEAFTRTEEIYEEVQQQGSSPVFLIISALLIMAIIYLIIRS